MRNATSENNRPWYLHLKDAQSSLLPNGRIALSDTPTFGGLSSEQRPSFPSLPSKGSNNEENDIRIQKERDRRTTELIESQQKRKDDDARSNRDKRKHTHGTR